MVKLAMSWLVDRLRCETDAFFHDPHNLNLGPHQTRRPRSRDVTRGDSDSHAPGLEGEVTWPQSHNLFILDQLVLLFNLRKIWGWT